MPFAKPHNQGCADKLIGYWCSRVASAIRGEFDNRVRRLGLNHSHAIVLFALHRESPQSIGQLSAELGQTHPSILRLVQQLRHAGFVSSAEDPGDRRIHAVCITSAGDALVAELTAVAEALNAEAGAGLNADAKSELLSALRRVHENISRMNGAPLTDVQQ